MKSGMLRKLMALLMAVMLIVPMVAQADESSSEFGSVTISDLVINYAGTEFDFSGLELELMAGADVETRDAMLGAIARVQGADGGSGLVMQVGAEDMLLLLGDQLLKLPYEGMEETLANMGVDAEGAGDIAAQLELFWEAVASADEYDADELLGMFEVDIGSELLNDQINALVAEAVPEDATFTVNGVDYEGQVVNVTVSAEVLNEVLASEEVQAYFDQMAAVMTGMFTQMGLDTMEVNGDEVAVEEYIATLMGAARNIKYADDMNVSLYVAPYDDEKSAVLIDYGVLTIDMSEYAALIASMDEDVEDVDALLAMISQMSITERVAMIGEFDEDFDFDDAEFMQLDVGVLNPEDGSTPIAVNMIMQGDEAVGSFGMGMLVSEPGYESEAAGISMSADWAMADEGQTINASLVAYEGSDEVMSIVFTGNAVESGDGSSGEYNLDISESGSVVTLNLSYNYAQSDDDAAEGNVTFQIDDGNSGLTPVASLDYTVQDTSADDVSGADVVFSADLMGMLTASGRLSAYVMPMSEDTLLPGDAAIDLSTADEDELESVVVNFQNNLQTTLMSAMNIPGVQMIISMMNTAE